MLNVHKIKWRKEEKNKYSTEEERRLIFLPHKNGVGSKEIPRRVTWHMENPPLNWKFVFAWKTEYSSNRIQLL